MTACYLDTSILVGLLLKQNLYEGIYKRLQGMQWFGHQLLISELLAVGKREGVALPLLVRQVHLVNIVSEIPELESICMKILELGYCRGADLHHLACAYFLDPSGKDLLFATADHQQAKLAGQIGFTVITP